MTPTPTHSIPPRSSVPDPTHALVTRWHQDPFSRGSYTYLGLEASWEDRRALQGRISERLFFAGEASSAGHAGTVHGAYLSGEAAARDLLERPPAGDRTALVLGAGVAGLRAAQVLRGAGWGVSVLEGRDRVGGRVHTDLRLGFPLDLGASWVHGAVGNPVAGVLERLGVALAPTPGADAPWQVLRPHAPPLTPQELERGHSSAARLLEGLCAERDLGAAGSVRAAADRVLGRQGSDALERGFAELMLTFEYELSTSSENLPIRAGNEPYACPGGDALPLGGYAPLIAHLAQGADILLGRRVVRVLETAQAITLETDAESFSASAALCTLPLGVLQAGTVAFEPELPAGVRQAIGRLGMGVLDKVALTFPHKFWHGDGFAVLDDQPRAHGYWLDLTSHTGTPTLIRFVYGSEAVALEHLTDAEIVQDSLELLRSLEYG